MRIQFPWGVGLGCWGLSTSKSYRDIRHDKGGWYVFVGDRYDERSLPQRQSWYKVVRIGWKLRLKLLRRVDKFGEWQLTKDGKSHRKPMLWVTANAAKCIEEQTRRLARELRPYQVIDWYGRTVEIISCPFPTKDGIHVMLQLPGDPTTMTEQTLVNVVEVA